jgi:protocatechuate 3,4-dioxygenase alpha subunit
MSDRPHPVATSSQTVGPFFHFGLTANESLGRIAAPGADGVHIRLRVRVLDGAGAPVPDAIIEVYQADAAGHYAGAQPPRAAGFTGFGRLPTDADGWCVFETIKPGAVPAPGREQAPHLNVCLLSRGLLRQIYTRVYFDGDAGQAADPILALVPAGRRGTLLARPSASASGLWDFVIRLQGEDETVFFDL